MEGSNSSDSGLKDSVTFKRKNLGNSSNNKLGNQTKIANKHKNDLKSSPSPVSTHKKFKCVQSSTINTWLTKVSTQKRCNLGHTNKSSNSKKICSENVSDGNSYVNSSPSCNLNGSRNLSGTQGHIIDYTDPSIQDKNENKPSSKSCVKEKDAGTKYKQKKKSEPDGPRETISATEDNINNNIKEKSCDKPKIKNSNKVSCALQDNTDITYPDLMNIESTARKKFKRIITSSISLENLPSKNVSRASVSPQVNTVTKWLSRYDSSSSSSSVSFSNSAKEKFKKKEYKENMDNCLENKDNCNVYNQSKFKYSEPPSFISKKSQTNESSKSDSDEVMKYRKRTSSSTSDIKNKGKQTEAECICITPTKHNKNEQNAPLRRSPRNTKTAQSTSVSSASRKLFDIDLFSQNNTINTWLSKDMTRKSNVTSHTQLSGRKPSIKSEVNGSKSSAKTNNKNKKLDIKSNSDKPKEFKNDNSKKKSKSNKKSTKQSIHNYLSKSSKESTKPKFSRTESNESYEFPSFIENNKKLKKNRTSDSFKKYGMTVPSVEEILKEQQDLAKYKNQIESFEDVDDKYFELPFSVMDLKNNQEIAKENILGCKHLSVHDIEEAFSNNLDYISNIFNGKKYSERHEKFFDARTYTSTIKELCYSTSTIVFSFEQKEHMMLLLKKEFDPDDKWTSYFFQVLLPELCLKIFMDAHNMTYDEAVKYLDTRPIIDD